LMRMFGFDSYGTTTIPAPQWLLISVTIFFQSIAWILARVLLAVLARVEVRGLENLKDLPKGVIFAGNHINDIDSVLIRTALPLWSRFAPLFAVARQRKDYQWRGWKAFVYNDLFFRLLGAYPAFSGTHDYVASLRLIVSIVRKDHSLIIFTGGKQKTPTEPVCAHGGTGYLVFATGHPVVPVAIEGSYVFGPKTFLKRPSMVVQFGHAIKKSELFTDLNLLSVDACKHAAEVVVHDIETMRHVLRDDRRN